jgi:hypothetical protein
MGTNTAGTGAQEYVTRQVHYLIKKIIHSDDGVPKSVGHVPAGAVITRARAYVATAFNDGGADLIDIGTAADPDGLAVDLNVATAGWKEDATSFNASDDIVCTADTQIVAQYDGASSDMTAGVAYVVVEYVVDHREVA